MSHTVGLIGLGLLGSALAERLLAAGFPVRGHDINPARMDALAQLGGEPVGSPADAARGAWVVLTCLMTADIVRDVVLGSTGAATEMARDAILLDITTCAPAESRRLAADLAAHGIRMLDAPLSGSSSVARAGELLAMVGGPLDAFEECRPLLDTFASHVVYVGENGAGASAKLVTNLILGLNRLALAEGLALGLRAGLDPDALLELLGHSAAASRALAHKGRRMVSGDFAPDAKLSQHLKDVRLIRDFGEKLGAALPATRLHEQLLEQAVADGLGELDNSAIIRALMHSEGMDQSPV
jgi:3-hydroxyisobutyrate dehydrogenase